ncbi:NAD-dependent epimerase/dehydratase family protein [Calditerricola satsumensis]|uniref:Putative UDP-glucose epimerase YtcB n=1 Tax=Calditerricola satsumensis TaxID=373054 RepID=A0A8J3B8G0_9BACI|nr:NAD-dependent epimerase/dehydratase family protein [Calditerricola satsumensis]GGK03113.1 putative UDP-glucose epimerase YtcB [Calditerricola satsumensis]
MNILVTGAAGFIGSHLCERLLDAGHTVIGVDALLNPSLRPLKRRNLTALLPHPRFRFVEAAIQTADWATLLDGVDAIFHLAGMPGVRTSWGANFSAYVEHNILATQRLLEACARRPLQRFVFASTSSVYGHQTGKVAETRLPAPLSPYGVTKLAGEHLCRAYAERDGLPVVILRYFTVYGPRQRPDMAFHRFIRALLVGEPIPLYGDGHQTRDFTYIADCIDGTVAALTAPDAVGETINIGGTERASLREVIALLEDLTGRRATIAQHDAPQGEPRHTWADISKAQRLLGYRPQVDLRTGLARQIDDLERLYARESV